jgi:uncharacterized protein
MSELTTEPLSSVKIPGTRRFTAGTIFIPLAFIALHLFVTLLIALIYLFAYLLTNPQIGNAFDLLADQVFVNKFLNDHYPIIAVIYSALLIPIYGFFLAQQRRHDRRVLLVARPRVTTVIPAMAIMVGVLGVTNLWFGLLQELGKTIPFIQNALNDYESTQGSFTPVAGYFWLILGVTVMAPVTEELLFRGVTQGQFRRAMPEWLAIILQGIIFALYHMQVIQISYVILPAMLLGLVYYWTRSIWVSMAMHISFNFMGSVVPALVANNELAATIVGWVELAFIIVAVLCLIYLHQTRQTSPVEAA